MLRSPPTDKEANRPDTVETAVPSVSAGACGSGYSSANELVGRLSPQSQRQLLGHCQPVRLIQRQVLQARGAELRHAYFIESGAASLTTRAGESPPVEIPTLGRKDFIGLPLVLGMRISPHRCIVQAAGQALQLAAEDLVHLIKTNVELQKLLLGYVQATLMHSSQLAVCNSRHSLNQRLAGWLLVAMDRLNSNEIALPHRATARALAARCARITAAIDEMEKLGLIRRSRGRIVVIDEARLEAMSCDCHRVIKSVHERSLSATPNFRIYHS